MPDVFAIASLLAPILISRWQVKSPNLSLPDLTGVTAGLRYLTSFVDLVLPDATGITESKLKKIEDKIREFQTRIGLDPTGVLDLTTSVNMTTGCKECNDDGVPPAISDPRAFIILYHIDAEMRNMSLDGFPLPALIDGALRLWTRDVFNIAGFVEDDASKANVFIKFGNIDGKGPVLGRANVAGPGRLIGPLFITMESDQGWDAKLFQTAICHEFGHILGVEHNPERGNLMSAVIGSPIPTPSDLALMRAVWNNAHA